MSEPRLSPFSFESESFHPDFPWGRRGTGVAAWREVCGSEAWDVVESGRWWSVKGFGGAVGTTGVAFRRCFRFVWSGESCIQILDTKSGGEKVHLVDLKAEAGGLRWDSVGPHLCGEDRYEACVRVEDSETVEIEWWSRGPRKDYRILTRYRDVGKWVCWLGRASLSVVVR